MGKPSINCDLCHVKNKAWTEKRFFGITSCRVHQGQPLIVLIEHRAILTEDEKIEMEELAKKYYGKYRPRNKGMASNPFHYHEHWIKKS